MKIKVVKSLVFLDKLKADEPIFADIETEKLYVGVRLVQLYQPTTSDVVYILDTDIVDINSIKEVLKDKWLVFHNASYDLGTLNMVPRKVDDTLYLARTAHPEWEKFSLDNCVSKMGLFLYEDLDKKKLQKKGFKKGVKLTDEDYRYAATDVLALSKLWEDKAIQRVRNVTAYKLDIITLRHIIKIQQNGLVVDRNAVHKELEKIQGIIAQNEEELNGLNVNSPKQVKEALCIQSSSKDILIELITNSHNEDTRRLAKLVYDQRRLLKRRAMLESYDFTKVYTRFNPAGAATGRFTSTGGDLVGGINAQQIPRDLQYIFSADTDDTVAIHADYATAQLRSGCSIMGDQTMRAELIAKKDLHKLAATLALGCKPEDVTKEGRTKGKAISFGFIFSMSAATFKDYAFVNYGVKFTDAEAKEIRRKYQEKYKGITRYAQYWWDNYKTKFVTSPLGRRNKPKLGTDAINFATQAAESDTTKLGLHYLLREYPEAINYVFNIVHDAIDIRVPKYEADIWAERLAKAMKKGWTELCKVPMMKFKDIPMPVEVEYNSYSVEHKVKEF